MPVSSFYVMKRIIRICLLMLSLGIALLILARAITAFGASGRIYADARQVPSRKVAIVFGAGVRNGQPSAMLYDRVASAVALYKAGTVRKLLMSGDNRFENYNEPGVMRQTALRLGVPNADIVQDFAGHSTYDTCYRARDIFGLREAVLVTQDFHLDRALMICDALGVKSVGYAADRRAYRSLWWNDVRELAATANAFVELFITKPVPVLGERIEIANLPLLHF